MLQSYIGPVPQSNPYIIQLHESLEAASGVEPRDFSWRHALLGGFDIFHAHWPEALIERRGAVSTAGRQVLYGLFLLKMLVLGIPVVRTMHNIDAPQGIGRSERFLLAATDRLTRMRILLNEFTPVPEGQRTALIEHGHYRDWFSKHPLAEPEDGRVLFFGKVRRYKNVEGLVRAFRGIPADAGLSLHVVGSPSSTALSEALRTAAGEDARITMSLRFVEEDDLVREVGESRLVVLPYPEMHNSGSVLAALSLDRVVLVPDNPFNRALEDEVGEGWVIRFEGEIDSRVVERAARAAETIAGRPDLSRRDWARAGARHLAAYRRAILGDEEVDRGTAR